MRSTADSRSFRARKVFSFCAGSFLSRCSGVRPAERRGEWLSIAIGLVLLGLAFSAIFALRV